MRIFLRALSLLFASCAVLLVMAILTLAIDAELFFYFG